MIYSAYTQIPDEFPTFEAAVEYLKTHPGSEGREPVAVLILTESNSQGAVAEEVDGVPAEPGESQVYRVTVAHEVFGKKFTIEYIVEFGAIPEEEEDGHVREEGDGSVDESGLGPNENPDGESENGSEPGTGDKAGVEQPNEGVGEGSEEPIEAPVDELSRWESDGGESEPDEAD